MAINKHTNQGAISSKPVEYKDDILVATLRARFSKKRPKCERIFDTLLLKYHPEDILTVLSDAYTLSLGGIIDKRNVVPNGEEAPEIIDDIVSPGSLALLEAGKENLEHGEGKGVSLDTEALTKSLTSNIVASNNCLINFESSFLVFKTLQREKSVSKSILDIFFNWDNSERLSPENLYESAFLRFAKCEQPFFFKRASEGWLFRLHLRTNQTVDLYTMSKQMFIALQTQPFGKALVFHLLSCKKTNCNCSTSRNLINGINQCVSVLIDLYKNEAEIFEYLRGMPMDDVRELIRVFVMYQTEQDSKIPPSQAN